MSLDRPKPSWAALKAATRRRDAERNARRGQAPPPAFDSPTKEEPGEDPRIGKNTAPDHEGPAPALPAQMRLL